MILTRNSHVRCILLGVATYAYEFPTVSLDLDARWPRFEACFKSELQVLQLWDSSLRILMHRFGSQKACPKRDA